MENSRLSVNSPSVIHENIDSEVVIINLDSGNYYSLSGDGSGIWSLLSLGFTPKEIATACQNIFTKEDPSFLCSEVLRFTNELLAEGLFRETKELANSSVDFGHYFDSTKSFRRPEILKYSDMQELLLLDPVHEVDSTGWPNEKPRSASD